MKITALMDFHLGVGAQEEIIRLGDTFTPRGTGTMSVAEHARSLIRQGVAMEAGEKADARVQRILARRS
jgi:hypothetical protein